MNKAAFERLAAEALDSLPESFLRHMENVDVVIEQWPSADDMEDAGLAGEDRRSLLGLYEGVPLVDRGTHYAGYLPDRIVLYQGSIEAAAGNDPDAIREEVRATVIHEVAHFFGISDDRLDELGSY